MGQGEVTYLYNPYNPASFQGGLSANFGGNAWQDPPNSRYDIISLYTPEFQEDTFIKGKMKANQTHYNVGKKVRQTIKELGGTMPEDLPVAESIKSIETKQRNLLKNK